VIKCNPKMLNSAVGYAMGAMRKEEQRKTIASL
jgi:hypothetical protein